MPKINLAAYLECTEMEGPGKRFALWVQGCLKRCPGCCNEQMQDIVPKNIIDCDKIFDLIIKSKFNNNIEGVTFLGGEPMLQAIGLAYIAKKCRDAELSIITFTGYTLEELERQQILGTEQLIKYTDVLIDGPFIQELYDENRKWIGSTNQNIYYLTDRYKKGIETQDVTNGMEFRIDSKGIITVNGWPYEIN
ncbi:hypothetical protein Q428_12345 [Fervidicella metallireducens AeB]|uniref:Anaerobic ribonucleoside-triphosphate reductase-activating protein n=1 Tax=Fervidicella metallireducens AeB TaxID=1403537 RepID=A0A017RUR2_9CLOT|nr:4Fe-4S single cluster domain-containing protein [Fervidicella metallireducens]EYE87620.1 hypothetical protein Q428_12345 [Fervidicella metallireducens AeB]